MRLGSLDHRDEIIRVATVGYCRFPLPALSHGNRPPFENSEVPRPSVLPHLLAQVVRFHPLIEFMQHDVGQQRGNHTPLRNPFACRTKETTIDTARLDEPPEQGKEAPIGNTFADAFQQQSMMDRIEVAGEITFDHPASCGTFIVTFLQLHLDRAYRMVNAPSGSEAVGSSMEVALPDRFHGHQHRPLHNPIP